MHKIEFVICCPHCNKPAETENQVKCNFCGKYMAKSVIDNAVCILKPKFTRFCIICQEDFEIVSHDTKTICQNCINDLREIIKEKRKNK